MGYKFVKTSTSALSSTKITTYSLVLLFLFEFQLVSKAHTKVTLDSNGESKAAPFWTLCPFMTWKKGLSTAGAPRAQNVYTWPQKNTPAPSTAEFGHQPQAKAGQAQDPAWPGYILKVPPWSWISPLELHTQLGSPSFSGSCAELLFLLSLVNEVL